MVLWASFKAKLANWLSWLRLVTVLKWYSRIDRLSAGDAWRRLSENWVGRRPRRNSRGDSGLGLADPDDSGMGLESTALLRLPLRTCDLARLYALVALPVPATADGSSVALVESAPRVKSRITIL
jgi:hypothetical protein